MGDTNNQTNKTVLIVEDDAGFVSVITDKFKNLGVTILNANSADEGISALEANKVDLIWLDHYLLGEKTGYDFVARVKADPRFSKIPIFLVTNYDEYGNTIAMMQSMATEKNPKSYLEYGIDKYFVKSNSSLESIFKDAKKYLKL